MLSWVVKQPHHLYMELTLKYYLIQCVRMLQIDNIWHDEVAPSHQTCIYTLHIKEMQQRTTRKKTRKKRQREEASDPIIQSSEGDDNITPNRIKPLIIYAQTQKASGKSSRHGMFSRRRIGWKLRMTRTAGNGLVVKRNDCRQSGVRWQMTKRHRMLRKPRWSYIMISNIYWCDCKRFHVIYSSIVH